MVLAAILWIFQAGIFFLYGRGFTRLVKKVAVRGEDAFPSPMLVFLVGLAVVTTLAELLSLFMNLGALALGIMTVGALVLLALEVRRGNLRKIQLKPQKIWADHKGWLLIAALLTGIVLEISTSFAFHPQAI